VFGGFHFTRDGLHVFASSDGCPESKYERCDQQRRKTPSQDPRSVHLSSPRQLVTPRPSGLSIRRRLQSDGCLISIASRSNHSASVTWQRASQTTDPGVPRRQVLSIE